MRLSLLGPLVVGDATGPPVAPAGPRLRTLLATLALHANMPVSLDALAEAVWDGAVPPASAETLRSYVKRLRRALGPEAAARITARAPGYVIRLDELELDVLEFEALCREAGAALRSAAWAEASDSAARALGLWRAAPLLDVPSQVLRDEFGPRLEQLHAQVLGDRIEAELKLGHHERLVPQLRDLTARHPLHERWHAQLMLALARAGRPADALAAYRSARRVLRTELGVEPGPGLRRLHERVLAADAELLSPPRDAPAAAIPKAPRMLPTAVRHFTGRQSELADLTALLEQADSSYSPGAAPVICAVDGMAGIGKTALAVHAAHRLAPQFPDGQLFVDLHGHTPGRRPRRPDETLETLLRALDVPAQRIPPGLDARVALYRRHLADSRTLVLLDNAADEAQVRPLLPGTAGCLILVTSRRRLKGLDDAHVLSLDVPAASDAVALFREVAGPDRTTGSDAVLEEIVELCGRVPLAVRIVASLLRHRPAWSPDRLAARLRDRAGRIDVLRDGERDFGAVLNLSYQTLDTEQQRLFRRLSLLPGPDTDAYAAAALTDSEAESAAGLLEELVDHNLLLQHTADRYLMHELVRLHAGGLATQDPAPDNAAALGRVLDYFQHTAKRADARITLDIRDESALVGTSGPSPSLPDAASALAWLRAERANLLACLDHCASEKDAHRITALSSGLAGLLRLDGPWHQALAVHLAALAAAERIDDRAGQADALRDAAIIRRMTGDLAGTVDELASALFLYRGLGDRPGQATVLNRLAEVRQATGDVTGALRDAAESLELCRQLDHRFGQATALSLAGGLRRLTGDYAGAVRDLKSSLRLYRELDHRHGQADAFARLAETHHAMGDYPAAIHDRQQALDLFRDQRNRQGEAASLAELGELLMLTGDAPAAQQVLTEAIRLFGKLGSRLSRAIGLTRLGTVRRVRGDRAGATRDLEEALRTFREAGSAGNEAWALNHYAAVFEDGGDQERAVAVYRDALELSRTVRQPDDEALALEGIGRCLAASGATHDGTAHLRQALELFRTLGMQHEIERVRRSCGRWLGESEDQADEEGAGEHDHVDESGGTVAGVGGQAAAGGDVGDEQGRRQGAAH